MSRSRIALACEQVDREAAASGARAALGAAGVNFARTHRDRPRGSGMTWCRAIWNSLPFDSSRLERKGLFNQGSARREPDHDLGPQNGGRSRRKHGQFTSRGTQPEHRILSLLHPSCRVARSGFAGGPLAALAARGKRRRQRIEERPAMVSYVRSTASVSGKESFVQIEMNFTSFVVLCLGTSALFLLMKLGFDEIGQSVDCGSRVGASRFEIEPAAALGGE
jgi:hypothetical protein